MQTSEELTQAFNNETLEDGDYWIKLSNGNVIVDHYSTEGDCYSFYSWGEDIAEVLAKVPSYEYWKKVIEELEQACFTKIGLEADLESALDIIARNKKYDEWLRLNYPKYYNKMKGGTSCD